MPKRHGNIYPKIIDIDNIKLAHQNARKDKSFYSAVQKTDEHLDERCAEIQKMLKDHFYQVSPYKTSIIHDKGKKRVLYKLPYYPDRIIQWAIMLQIEPIFKETFTDFTYASIPNRGIHRASAQLRKWLRDKPKETKYCLKLDIKKFYPNINRQILKDLLRKKFKDKDLLIVLDKIIDSMDNADISNLDLTEEEKQLYTQKGKGLPVGSYLSQYLANYYLAFFDHWLKEEKHCKYILRYMDDIIILGASKSFLRSILYEIKQYLQDELDLGIKSNYQIFPVNSRGIDFVGFRHFRTYQILRRSIFLSCKKINRKIKCHWPTEKEWCVWVSLFGWLYWCYGQGIYQKYFYMNIPYINAYYWIYKIGKYKKISYQFLPYPSKIERRRLPYENYKKRKRHARKSASFRNKCRYCLSA